MNINSGKSSVLIVNRGKRNFEETKLNNEALEFTDINMGDYYKYLGFNQQLNINKSKSQEEIMNKVMIRIISIRKTKLNGINLIKAINTFTITVVTYSFGIIKWSNTKLEEFDRKIRVLLTRNRYLHPRAAVERLYI